MSALAGQVNTSSSLLTCRAAFYCVHTRNRSIYLSLYFYFVALASNLTYTNAQAIHCNPLSRKEMIHLSQDGALLQRAPPTPATRMGVIAVSQQSTRRTLKQVRRQQLMSVHELADKAKVAASTIFRIEEEGKTPRLATIRKLVEALDVDATSIEWPGDPLSMEDSADAK